MIPANNNSICKDINTLKIGRFYRLGIYCILLWFWIASAITYYGIFLHDQNGIPKKFQILFYLVVTAVALMIIGTVFAVFLSSKSKKLQYFCGSLWIIAGCFIMAATVQRYTINDEFPKLWYLFTDVSSFCIPICFPIMIGIDIAFDVGSKLYYNIIMHSLIIFIASFLWILPLFHVKNDEIPIGILYGLRFGWICVCLSSISLFILFIVKDIQIMQNGIRFYCIFCILLLFFGGPLTQIYWNGQQMELYLITYSSLHSELPTIGLYLLLMYNSSLVILHFYGCSKNSINNSFADDFLLCEKLKSLKVENTSQLILNVYRSSMLNLRHYRLCLLSIFLWFWILPDFYQQIICINNKSVCYAHGNQYLIISYALDIVAIIMLLIVQIPFYGLSLNCSKSETFLCKIIAFLFIFGSIFMCVYCAYECKHECQNSDCGIAIFCSYLLGILLPMVIAFDAVFNCFNEYWKRFRMFVFLFCIHLICILWTFIVMKYALVDSIYVPVNDTLAFRMHLTNVLRFAWVSMSISSFMLLILCLIRCFSGSGSGHSLAMTDNLLVDSSSMKRIGGYDNCMNHRLVFILKYLIYFLVFILLIGCGICILDENGGQVLTKEWSAKFPENSLFTFYAFVAVTCYDILMNYG